MAANYTNRDERPAEAVSAMQEAASVQDAPSLFHCRVCGVEMSETVPIMAISAGLDSAFYCREHVPKEWRHSS